MGVRLMQRAKPMAELLVILLVITCTFVAGSEGDKKELEITRGDLDAEPHRLSHKVKPLEYEIDLTLQNGFDSLAGTVNIILEFVARKIEPETLKSRSSAPKLTLSLFGGSKQRKSKAAKDEIKMNEIKETAENEDNQWGSIDLSMDGSKLKVTDAKMQVARHIGALRSEAGEKLDYMREEIEIDRVLVDVSKQMISLRLARGVSVVNKFGRITITYETVTPDDEASLEKSETLRGGTPNQKRIFSSPAIRGLFPSFDEVTFESKFRVTIRQPASDETILSSLPKRADTIILVDPVKGIRLRECRFDENRWRHPSEIGFAIGQLFPLPRRDGSNDATVLEYGSVPTEFVDFVSAHYPRFQAWIRENRPKWSDNFPISRVLGTKFIVIGGKKIHRLNTGPLNDVESALTMALLAARHSLRKQFKTEPQTAWFREGMIVHLAIEMVRELEPSLQVDAYVRSKLIPRALEQETGGIIYETMRLDYPMGGKRSPETGLYWRLKSAALLDLLKRKFYVSHEPFDLGMARLTGLKGIYHKLAANDIAGALKSSKHSQEEIQHFISIWVTSGNFPYIEASLDKHGNGVTFIQVPIRWLDRFRHQFAKDTVFPMSIRVNFSIGMEIKDHKIVEFDTEHASYKLAPLPDWFQHSNPEHRISFDVVHPEELPYYRMSFASDSMTMLNKDEE